MTPMQIADAREKEKGSVRFGAASLLVYLPESVPDYGPWPISERDCSERDEKRLHVQIGKEVARRRKLFGHVHRLDEDQARVTALELTVCLRKRSPTIHKREVAPRECQWESDVFATTEEVDVTCGNCLAVIAHLRAIEKMKRGLR